MVPSGANAMSSAMPTGEGIAIFAVPLARSTSYSAAPATLPANSRPDLSIPRPWTPWNAEPGTSLVTSYVCAEAPVARITAAATVAPNASLLAMTLPPVLLSGEYSFACVVWQTKLVGAARRDCHKNDTRRGVTEFENRG